MPNIIIIAILLILMIFGVKETIKHFKGEGACCGGASHKVKKKKLEKKVTQKYVLQIEGMHCKHCVNTVTEVINDFEGAAGKVNLDKKEAVVLCDRAVDIEEIKEKIRRHGYEVQ